MQLLPDRRGSAVATVQLRGIAHRGSEAQRRSVAEGCTSDSAEAWGYGLTGARAGALSRFGFELPQIRLRLRCLRSFRLFPVFPE
jgi:hypothetical protein